MMQTVSHVDATFGGRSVRFELPRDRATIGALEHEIGAISAAWGRFGGGDWRVSDVRAILQAAHPRVRLPAVPHAIEATGHIASVDETLAMLSKGRTLPEPELSHRLAMPKGKTIPAEMQPVSVDRIDRVMARRPLATYASLATLILGAAMFGLPEAAALFDEDTALVAAPPADEVAA